MSDEKNTSGPIPAAGEEERAISDEDLVAADSVPAVFVTRIIATSVPNGMRLTFGEQLRGNTYMRTAVFMDFAQAEQLRDLIDRQLSRLKKVALTLDEEGNLVPSDE